MCDRMGGDDGNGIVSDLREIEPGLDGQSNVDDACGLGEQVEAPAQQPKRRIKARVFSRVVGYYAPVDNWNKGKRQEWAERRTYDVPTTGTLEKMGQQEDQ